MRHTLFAVSAELAPYVDASTARAIAVKERRTLLSHLDEDGERAGRDVARRGRGSGARRPRHTRPRHRQPALRRRSGPATKITVFPGKKYETVQGVATRVIRLLAADGRIRRDRPRGSWTSSQFRWTAQRPLARRCPPPRHGPRSPAAGCSSYGPATEADLKWWTGWTLGDVRKALAAVGRRPGPAR